MSTAMIINSGNRIRVVTKRTGPEHCEHFHINEVDKGNKYLLKHTAAGNISKEDADLIKRYVGSVPRIQEGLCGSHLLIIISNGKTARIFYLFPEHRAIEFNQIPTI
jgi:hypothetical protein